MTSKQFKYWIIGLILSGIFLLQTVSPVAQAQSNALTAGDAVQDAWDLAKEAAAYRYTSHVIQTTYPAPAIQNVGKPPHVDAFSAVGDYDQIAQQMHLEVNNQNNDWFEIEIDGLDARGRTSAESEWEEFGSVNEFFAPGGDPLGFLAGATQIQKIELDTSDLGVTDAPSAFRLPPSAFRLYSFTFSGYEFGRFVTDEMTHQLIASGEMMPERRLEVADTYRRMNGTGEIQIDDAGYPVEIRIELDMGVLETGEQATADIHLTYQDFTPSGE